MNGYKYKHELIKWPNFQTVVKQDQALDWCRENFGEDPDRWGLYIDGFNFNNEQDYILFVLRWV